MTDRKPTLRRLSDANPRAYAELCETAGCYSAALEYYSGSKSALDLLHAAELANELGQDRRRIKRFCVLARDLADADVGRATDSSRDPTSGAMGAAYDIASAQDAQRKVYEGIEKLLGARSR